ncbi:anhydro-N-acetylmuramic acid kinase [Thermomicrobiaceae bacterium CFH 74404]|uniref:Anhydro-N-acetylmuramic acid kinase n=1 Tax=Thermalbibacter longus TaxID=2951981 RepID=A0AA41WII6_9BACT|nr:anhydro-N-acetylmuramic acid kinase [Thermalbibacter longus]MCM8749991.1 anhydro-N-acetylmuramic acid kinase [Thermalbibacter longus]
MASPAGTTARHGDICVGLMSGTSADAIDAAVVGITGAGATARLELLGFGTMPLPPEVRRELFLVFDQAERAVERLCSLNVVLGELFADAARTACRQAGVPLAQVFVIGSHGQTVWHQPERDSTVPISTPSTLQIGEPAVIAERTGVPVMANFRAADIAAGGQGAPLVPYFDWVTLRHPERSRAVQNIGGIANVTYLPAGGDIEDVRAFDTGPGNALIDGVVTLLTGGTATFDADGRLAAQGSIDEGLLARLLADPYLNRPPPKTTGRERYGLPLCRRLLEETGLPEGALADPAAPFSLRQRALDLVATVTAFTARSIAEVYRRWLPPIDEVIVSGGGSRNPALLSMLRAALDPVPVVTLEAYGIDSKAKEAMAFALPAHDGLLGLPTNVPGTTGARRQVILGTLTPPTGIVPRSQGKEGQV